MNKIDERRAEMKKIFLDFLEGQGQLPAGFEERYNIKTDDGYIIHGTPFETFLKLIQESVDSLNNRSGISDWLYFSGSVEINTAVETICDWAKQHREINNLLKEKCKIGNTYIIYPLPVYCREQIMIVTNDGQRLAGITEASIQRCKAYSVSFCTIITSCKMYDLIERKEKAITFVTYPNYHDETYADWYFE